MSAVTGSGWKQKATAYDPFDTCKASVSPQTAWQAIHNVATVAADDKLYKFARERWNNSLRPLRGVSMLGMQFMNNCHGVKLFFAERWIGLKVEEQAAVALGLFSRRSASDKPSNIGLTCSVCGTERFGYLPG
jgi:hypothetical protein